TRKFAKKLDMSRLRVKARRVVRGLGAVGYAAKGAAYAVVGVLLVVAGVTFDPNKSRGLDGAIRTIAQEPYGKVLLVVVAAGIANCRSCQGPDDQYIWVDDRWRVRATPKPPGLPVVLILEPRMHLDLGDLPNLEAAELGLMTVRLERAIRSTPGVARVHVNR